MSTSSPPRHVIQLSSGFWNIRGSFRLGCLVDLGTHTSLVRRTNGKYVFLDSYSLDDDTLRWVDGLTGGRDEVEAVLHLHPFHTLHVRRVRELYPRAKLYGTARHAARFTELSWERVHTEDPAFHTMFADDFDFTMPRGVDFISTNENVHFSSVLAVHRASRTLHVDDTIMYVPLPRPLRLVARDLTLFHPTLAKALQPRPGAAGEFRAWARELIERARDVDNLCAAHTATLSDEHNPGPSIAERIEGALERDERTLRAHQRRHG